jgi:hypothetical protein
VEDGKESSHTLAGSDISSYQLKTTDLLRGLHYFLSSAIARVNSGKLRSDQPGMRLVPE